MNRLKLLSTAGIAFLYLFSSCNGNESKTITATTDSTVTNSDAKPKTSESTVVTTPENVMEVWHKVADFTKWKASYDQHDSMRVSNGIHSYLIGREVDDTNMVLVVTKVDDIAKAKAFAKDPSLKTAMQKGGVIGAPSITINTIVYQDMAQNMSDLRSMTMFTVKDFDAWKPAFENHRQTRIDNGLTDRAYGYNTEDKHKVIVVTGINDSAKASAFWKSDILKQLRAESGVVGDVKRYVYRVVKKY